jgi:vacuolar-type H+-ATPase subunit I/STV1
MIRPYEGVSYYDLFIVHHKYQEWAVLHIHNAGYYTYTHMRLIDITQALFAQASLVESYSNYLSTLIATIKSPQKMALIKPNVLNQMAGIVTALSIVSNEKFRATLKLSDADVVTMVSKLGSDPAVTSQLLNISKKSPSQLSALITLFTNFTKLPAEKQQELIVQVTKLDKKLQTLVTEKGAELKKDAQEIDKVTQIAVPNLTL